MHSLVICNEIPFDAHQFTRPEHHFGDLGQVATSQARSTTDHPRSSNRQIVPSFTQIITVHWERSAWAAPGPLPRRGCSFNLRGEIPQQPATLHSLFTLSQDGLPLSKLNLSRSLHGNLTDPLDDLTTNWLTVWTPGSRSTGRPRDDEIHTLLSFNKK
jgi:hypothetical protein